MRRSQGKRSAGPAPRSGLGLMVGDPPFYRDIREFDAPRGMVARRGLPEVVLKFGAVATLTVRVPATRKGLPGRPTGPTYPATQGTAQREAAGQEGKTVIKKVTILPRPEEVAGVPRGRSTIEKFAVREDISDLAALFGGRRGARAEITIRDPRTTGARTPSAPGGPSPAGGGATSGEGSTRSSEKRTAQSPIPARREEASPREEPGGPSGQNATNGSSTSRSSRSGAGASESGFGSAALLGAGIFAASTAVVALVSSAGE